ncbi:MAG: methylmalonyl-CoA mutase [Hyphomicrobiaceae bacterium]|nr:methylmalonyl-CoA mutase [Hyphomicrobiaceae bacterium]
MTIQALATGFDTANDASWKKAVEKALKGAPPERLNSRTRDGIAVAPLYARDENPSLILRAGVGQPWRIAARVDHPVAAEANALALADLQGGVSTLVLVGPGSPWSHGFGLTVDNLADLDRALENVLLDLVEWRIDAGYEYRYLGAALLALAAKRGIAADQLTVAFGFDPLGYLAARGTVETHGSNAIVRLVDAVGYLATTGVKGSWFTADGRPWHAAGASEAQELAAIAASTRMYWQLMLDAGLDLETAAARTELLVVADQNQFATIAKLRAARLIHARMREAAGLAPAPVHIHAETAWRMMTRLDAHVNMLRGTIAGFAAGIGGADSVTVVPYTQTLGLPDAFARRVARNSQSILIEESNLHRVGDPAAGSGYVDTLTRQIAEAAWEKFQEIEAEGGLYASLQAGKIQARVAATAAEEIKAVARRRAPITGTSEFPNISETRPAVLEVASPSVSAAGDGVDLPSAGKGELMAAIVAAFAAGKSIAAAAAIGDDAGETVPALPIARSAEVFEELRDAADAYEAARGVKPQVFVATLGRIADFTARATWVRNLFEAGGLAARVGDGFASTAALVEAFEASGARVACIASSDAVYAEEAEKAARLLKNAGAEFVYLAGKPADDAQKAAQAVAGIDAYVHVGIDVVATLSEAQRFAGVIR